MLYDDKTLVGGEHALDIPNANVRTWIEHLYLTYVESPVCLGHSASSPQIFHHASLNFSSLSVRNCCSGGQGEIGEALVF